MKKISNKYKVLMALCSGPKTQAELVRETKVKNVYQMMSGLIKSGEVIKQDKKILLRDSLNPQYTRKNIRSLTTNILLVLQNLNQDPQKIILPNSPGCLMLENYVSQ
jgi:hypothetical protein